MKTYKQFTDEIRALENMRNKSSSGLVIALLNDRIKGLKNERSKLLPRP